MADCSYEEGLAQLKWQCSQYSEQLKKVNFIIMYIKHVRLYRDI